MKIQQENDPARLLLPTNDDGIDAPGPARPLSDLSDQRTTISKLP